MIGLIMWRTYNIRGTYLPKCPHCSGLLDVWSIKLRDAKCFACPTCHRLLEVVPHTQLLITGSLLLSALITWLSGFRGFLMAAVVFPLSLPIFVLESIVLGYFVPVQFRLYEGSGPLPGSPYVTLDLSGSQKPEGGSRESSSDNKAKGK